MELRQPSALPLVRWQLGCLRSKTLPLIHSCWPKGMLESAARKGKRMSSMRGTTLCNQADACQRGSAL